MDFRRVSNQDDRHPRFDCCLVRCYFDDDALVAVVAGGGGGDDAETVTDVAVVLDDYDFACVHWSLVLNGYYYETRWNDSLTVRCGFGDNLDSVLVARVDSENDVTVHLDS